ncbi:3-dehydroquinate synthase [Listeria ivanovii]|uniref:3-dehydroquinate synthase n=1 Tax=Listeria ivanovii TaxID=1638 RepID=UPI00162A0508|nr:3-dehydroquinate synthase [Listeria ivanovii]MBC1759101.1 3-dehydroquinate synthase [Listeria ivanovii]
MPEITVRAKSKTYPVYINESALEDVAEKWTKSLAKYSHVFVLTDEHVAELHQAKLDQILVDLSEVTYYVTPNGEKAKTFQVYEDVMTKMMETGLDRKAVLIAFGGGVIGDLGGFVAATYMRGIPFYQVPTTVLAHDSAVGGKVAINHPLGKNMIGNFYQPEAVIYDTSFFATLPEREMRSGFAEMIKHALISDQTLLRALMDTFTQPEDCYTKDLTPFLQRGIEIKASIVAEDETEQGVRAYLNFGHTFGHALEAYGNFDKWLHGEAITYGMIYALTMSERIYGLDFDLLEFKNWLKRLGYNTTFDVTVPYNKILENMRHDKKTTFNEITMVLLEQIGKPVIFKAEDELILETYTQVMRNGGDIF